jgi:hypothetical protein
MSAIGTKPSFEVDIFICDLGVAKIEGSSSFKLGQPEFKNG